MSMKTFNKHFSNIYKITTVSKLRSFQYRLLYWALVLNRFLSICNIIVSDECTFCNQYSETLEHVFLFCTIVKNFYEEIFKEITTIVPEFSTNEIELSDENIVYNCIHAKPGNIFNFILLVAKQYIYRCHCFKEKPSGISFINQVQVYKNIEKYNAIKFGSLDRYMAKWHNVHMSSASFTDDYVNDYINALT